MLNPGDVFYYLDGADFDDAPFVFVKPVVVHRGHVFFKRCNHLGQLSSEHEDVWLTFKKLERLMKLNLPELIEEEKNHCAHLFVHPDLLDEARDLYDIVEPLITNSGCDIYSSDTIAGGLHTPADCITVDAYVNDNGDVLHTPRAYLYDGYMIKSEVDALKEGNGYLLLQALPTNEMPASVLRRIRNDHYDLDEDLLWILLGNDLNDANAQYIHEMWGIPPHAAREIQLELARLYEEATRVSRG